MKDKNYLILMTMTVNKKNDVTNYINEERGRERGGESERALLSQRRQRGFAAFAACGAVCSTGAEAVACGAAARSRF